MPIVLVTEGSAPAPLAWLRDRAEVLEVPLSDPALPAALARAEGLIVRTYTKVTREFLKGCPNLRVVGRGGVGLENIDIPACRERGIEVVYTPAANTLAVGDFLFGALIRLIRPWSEFSSQAYTPAEFKRVRDSQRGKQLNEMTLGILGMGRVGRRVGRIAANGFGMNVLFHDIAPVEQLSPLDFPAQRIALQDLLARSDVLTIHTDMRDGNYHLIAAPQIAQMKPGAILINYARGELLDAAALASALKSGHLSAAAIDVYDPEPPTQNFPLLGLPNVLLTPHMAARTHTAIDNMSWVVQDIHRVLTGLPPEWPAP